MIFRRVMRHVTAAAVTLAAVVLCSAVRAQDLEPRAYSNSPTGLNFLIVDYGYATGENAAARLPGRADAQTGFSAFQ
jgi:hypothetical protein